MNIFLKIVTLTTATTLLLVTGQSIARSNISSGYDQPYHQFHYKKPHYHHSYNNRYKQNRCDNNSYSYYKPKHYYAPKRYSYNEIPRRYGERHNYQHTYKRLYHVKNNHNHRYQQHYPKPRQVVKQLVRHGYGYPINGLNIFLKF